MEQVAGSHNVLESISDDNISYILVDINIQNDMSFRYSDKGDLIEVSTLLAKLGVQINSSSSNQGMLVDMIGYM